LDVILVVRFKWEIYIETIAAKVFRTFLKSLPAPYSKESLNANIKLPLHRTVRSTMTYACPVWELVADTYKLH
jgi:hypothetical protein